MNKKMFLTILLFVVMSLACSLPFLDNTAFLLDGDSGANAAETGGLIDMDSESFRTAVEDPARLVPVPLSAPQAQILSARGVPNRFLIQFSEGMRQETWYFDLLDYEVTFRNGEIYLEKEIAVNPEEANFFSVYFPWQFNHQMGLSELLVISQTTSFAVESLEKIFEEDLSIVYLKGMDVGFREDRILYIRSIPLGEGAKQGSKASNLDQPNQQTEEQLPISTSTVDQSETSGLTLTANELANQGEHLYLIDCKYSDGDAENYSDVVSWDFTDEGVFFTGEGPFLKISENFYGYEDEYGGFFIQFLDSGVSVTGSNPYEDSEGGSVTLHYHCLLTFE